MKKLIFAFMLAMSISYGDEIKRDLERLITLTMQCGNNNFKQYVFVITNIAVDGFSDNSNELFIQFVRKHCDYEVVKIMDILDNYSYDDTLKTALLIAAVSSQMIYISQFLEGEYKKHARIITNMLKNGR